MRDPRRLVEGHQDSLERRVLLSASADRASPRSEAAALAAFSATLSLAAHGSAATGASALAAKSAWSLTLVKGVVGGLLAAATTVGTYAAVEASLHPRAARHNPAAAVRGPGGPGKVQMAAPMSGDDEVGAPTAPEPVVQEATHPAVRPEPRVSAYPYAPRLSRSSEVKQPESESLTREVALLREARLALARGDARAALVAIDRRDREFPQGSLGPEATLLRVESLVRAGDRARAKLVASSFLRRQPRGPHADRMRTLLGENKP
ncbi:MAG: hypothetical protein JW940_01490 [Polyangiaceae bacterium]|nr:hypothetical protein [Polyangiaceae bacterium]